MKYYTVMCDDCNLAHTEMNIAILREFPLTGLQRNFYPRSPLMSRI